VGFAEATIWVDLRAYARDGVFSGQEGRMMFPVLSRHRRLSVELPQAGLAGRRTRALIAAMVAASALLTGCTSLHEWWHNGFKVGPNYGRPPAPVADQWIDSDNPAVKSEATDYSYWWSTFNDPVLDTLITTAYRQNLSLKMAGLRILEARAQRGIAAGNLFPQQQEMFGRYARNEWSDTAYPFGDFPIRKHFDDWITGFDATWELDVWGRIRRGIESADANLNAQIESYDDVLVILQAEVAAAYVQMRTVENRLELARQNVKLQQDTLKIVQDRFNQGVVSELDVRQAKSAVATTESLIPMLEESHRKLQNALCILMGMPPQDLQLNRDGPHPIPEAPTEVVVGIPAELLRRRPDVRKAERQAAAQCAQIGIATAELYPHFAITGNIALNAENFSELYRWDSIAGSVGPGFQWNILNYGRIRNNIEVQDVRFQQAVLSYQDTVLKANKEVEDAIVSFLREKVRHEFLAEAVGETQRAAELALLQYNEGIVDYQRVLDTQRALVLQQDATAESQGKVALNLVAVYKAIGGGWRMRYSPSGQVAGMPTALPPLEETPTPVGPAPAAPLPEPPTPEAAGVVPAKP
jgi:NodT family efflux transporter outer membrane factor (OMF) lipoprotein